MTMHIWTPDNKPVLPPGLRKPIFPGERGFQEAFRLSGLVNTGLVNAGHAMVNAGQIRVAESGGIPGLQDAVAYWKMEEASGDRADSAGSNTLTDNNTVTQAAGKLGNAASFASANSEYLSITDNAALSVGATTYTAIAWWYISDKSVDRFVFGKGTAFNKTGMEYGLYYNQAADRISFVMYSPTDYLLRKLNDTTLGSPSTNTWYMTAITESSAGAIGIGTNGNWNSVTATVSAPVDGTGAFTVGAYLSDKYWEGRIDSIGIWKRSLSNAELDSLYNSGTGADAY